MKGIIGTFRVKPIALGMALLGGAGCSDSTAHLNDAAAALSQYYAEHPFERDWQVTTIAILEQENKLVARVEINAEGDVARLRTLSSMEQFTVAKLACPAMTPDLRNAMGDTRIWVALTTGNKQITTSICPQ